MGKMVEVRKENEPETLYLTSYFAVREFKSIRRAIRRGLVTPYGTMAPRRPFNNRKRTLGRKFQIDKERIYAEIKSKQSVQ